MQEKADAFLGFADGTIRTIITKPSIAAFGLNWQHCARMVFVGTERLLRGVLTRPSAAATGTADPDRPRPRRAVRPESQIAANIARKERSVGHRRPGRRNALRPNRNGDRITTDDAYVTDDAHGQTWHLMLGDSCERLAEIPDDSVHLSVYSPPFASLFTYSPSPRDLGNLRPGREFIEHYGFIIRENLRVTIPGRVACVHVQQLTTTKTTHGFVGLTDFRGQVIQAYVNAGWIFHGEVTVNKHHQAQAIRTKGAGPHVRHQEP